MARKVKKDSKDLEKDKESLVSKDDKMASSSKTKSSKSKNKSSKNKFKSRKEDKDTKSSSTSKSSVSGDMLTSILTRYPEDYLNTSNLFFSNKLGLVLPRSYFIHKPKDKQINAYLPQSAEKASRIDVKFQLPGIMKINLRPHIDSSSELSIINSLSSSMFKFIRSANSGATNYESTDLMVYHLAIVSLYAQMARLQRMYGLVGSTRMMNMYWGDKLLESLNVDEYHLYDKQAAFRSAYNVLVRKINTLALPKYNLIPQRWSYMLNNIFTDGMTETSQYYLFDMPYLMEFNGYTDRKGGKLVVNRLMKNEDLRRRVGSYWVDENSLKKSNMSTMLDPLLMMKYLSDYVDSLLNDSDFNIMNGDILKAFGNDNLYQLEFLSEELTSNPVFDPSILSEINNSNIAPFHMTELVQEGKVSWGNDRRSILRTKYSKPDGSYQGDHWIENQSDWKFMKNYMFNSLSDSPTAEEVIRGTRLMSLVNVDYTEIQIGDTMYAHEEVGDIALYAGTETVESYTIYVAKSQDEFIVENDNNMYINRSTLSTSWYNRPFYVVSTSKPKDILKMFKFIMRATRFAFCPRFTIWYEGDNPTDQSVWEHGDMSRFTVINGETLSKIHRSAAQSMFGLPSITSNHKFSESGGQKSKMTDKK